MKKDLTNWAQYPQKLYKLSTKLINHIKKYFFVQLWLNDIYYFKCIVIFFTNAVLNIWQYSYIYIYTYLCQKYIYTNFINVISIVDIWVNNATVHE